MKPLISIIIPIFQVEKYIANTINSIIHQSYDNFEIILVNDGTKDNSVEVAKKILQSNNFNYKLINQKNKGLSSARNTGIIHSQGEWIVMVDSDDVICKDYLKILYNGIEKFENQKEKPLVSFGGYKVVNKDDLFDEPKKIASYDLMNKKDIIHEFLIRKKQLIVPSMLINRQFIMENKLLFAENIKYSEDIQFIWRLLANVGNVVYSDSDIYNYFVHENSIMTSSTVEKVISGYFEILKLDRSDEIQSIDILKEYLLSRWVFAASRSSTRFLSYSDFKVLLDKMNYKKEFLNLLHFPDIKIKIMSLSCLISRKLFYKINKILLREVS